MGKFVVLRSHGPEPCMRTGNRLYKRTLVAPDLHVCETLVMSR